MKKWLSLVAIFVVLSVVGFLVYKKNHREPKDLNLVIMDHKTSKPIVTSKISAGTSQNEVKDETPLPTSGFEPNKSFVTTETWCDTHTRNPDEPYVQSVFLNITGTWIPAGKKNPPAEEVLEIMVKGKDTLFEAMVYGTTEQNFVRTDYYCFNQAGDLDLFIFRFADAEAGRSYIFEQKFQKGKALAGNYKGPEDLINEHKVTAKPTFKNVKDLLSFLRIPAVPTNESATQ